MRWFPFVLRSDYNILMKKHLDLSAQFHECKRFYDVEKAKNIQLMAELKEARKNDYRDEKGRFTKRKDA